MTAMQMIHGDWRPVQFSAQDEFGVYFVCHGNFSAHHYSELELLHMLSSIIGDVSRSDSRGENEFYELLVIFILRYALPVRPLPVPAILCVNWQFESFRIQ